MHLPQWPQHTPQHFRAGLSGAAVFLAAALIAAIIGGVFFGGERTPTVICFLLVLAAEMWAYDRYLS